MEKHRKSNKSSFGTPNRRRFLAGATAGLTAGALAGCVGSLGDDADSLDGTTIRVWSRVASVSPPAGRQMQSWVNQFEEETGVDVKFNPAPVPFGSPQKYQSIFGNDDYPVLFDMPPSGVGDFLNEEQFHPLGDWIDRISEERRQHFEWAIPLIEDQHSGFDIGDPNSFAFPWIYQPFTPMVARRDHLEAAGLDPESDFPPESYDEFLSIARTLQADGPADYATGMLGTSDAMDSGYTHWAMTAGGQDGRILNEDWTDTNMDNDVWKEQTRKYVDVFREHELATPQSPQLSDEDTLNLLANGVISMGWIELQNYPQFQNVNPDLVENDTLTWGPKWAPSGQWGDMVMHSFMLMKKPEDQDEDTWNRKQEAAVRLVEFLLSEEVQNDLLQETGQFPAHEGANSRILDEYRDDHAFNVGARIARNTDFVWPAKYTLKIRFVEGVPIGQRALRGEITPEEACDEWAAAARDVIQDG